MTIEPLDLPRLQWGEGALWHRDRLLLVDIKAHRVLRLDPDHPDTVESWDAGSEVGFVIPRRDQPGLVIGSERGLFFLDPADGALESIADPEPDLPDNRFNDGKCSPQGRLYAGTISRSKNTGSATLWRLDPDHSVHCAFPGVTNSNGIVWSADSRTCWYIDTPRRQVLAFDHDPVSGELSRARVAVDTSPIDASPDGMTLDTEGKIWVAFCHGGCVVRFDPHSGSTLQRIDLPALETTSCAFGGHDLADLFVTSGIHGSAQEEHGGRTFRIRGLGVRGVPAHAFAG